MTARRGRRTNQVGRPRGMSAADVREVRERTEGARAPSQEAVHGRGAAHRAGAARRHVRRRGSGEAEGPRRDRRRRRRPRAPCPGGAHRRPGAARGRAGPGSRAGARGHRAAGGGGGGGAAGRLHDAGPRCRRHRPHRRVSLLRVGRDPPRRPPDPRPQCRPHRCGGSRRVVARRGAARLAHDARRIARPRGGGGARGLRSRRRGRRAGLVPGAALRPAGAPPRPDRAAGGRARRARGTGRRPGPAPRAGGRQRGARVRAGRRGRVVDDARGPPGTGPARRPRLLRTVLRRVHGPAAGPRRVPGRARRPRDPRGPLGGEHAPTARSSGRSAATAPGPGSSPIPSAWP